MKKLFAISLAALFTVSMSACWEAHCHNDNGWCDDDSIYEPDRDNSWQSQTCIIDPWTGQWVCESKDKVDPGKDKVDEPIMSCVWNSDCNDPSKSCLNGVCVDNSSICRTNADCGDASKMCDMGKCVDVECRSNSECKDDNICTEGRCIPCQTDLCDTSKEVECVFSSQCESGICSNGSCLAPGACVIDANCEAGQICLDKVCVAKPECLSDRECPSGKICNASNKCEDDVECRKDADCGEGMLCISNMCAQCRLNCECPNEGDICLNGACVTGN